MDWNGNGVDFALKPTKISSNGSKFLSILYLKLESGKGRWNVREKRMVLQDVFPNLFIWCTVWFTQHSAERIVLTMLSVEGNILMYPRSCYMVKLQFKTYVCWLTFTVFISWKNLFRKKILYLKNSIVGDILSTAFSKFKVGPCSHWNSKSKEQQHRYWTVTVEITKAIPTSYNVNGQNYVKKKP